MASAVCAFCERFTHMTIAWAMGTELDNYFQGNQFPSGRYEGIAICDNCRRASMFVGSGPRPTGSPEVQADALSDDALRWFPTKGDAPEFPDVPEPIAEAAKEAHSSASVGNLRAAVVMARAVVEATAKEKGITSGTLMSKINELRDQGHIRPSVADAAHEVRLSGNDMAHGDLSVSPDEDDAAELLALMQEVLQEVFQGPARTARIKTRRAQASSAPTA